MSASSHEMANGWMRRSDRRIRGMARELRLLGKRLPAQFVEIHSAIVHCQASIHDLSVKFNAAYETNEARNESLTDTDIQQLLALNRQLRNIGPFLRSVADDLRPHLEGKLAAPNDPMYDYEIEARIDFILREDDPEYDEGDDNILTTREESLKYEREERCADYSEPCSPEGLRAEAHCWHFHDLYDHDYGFESPSLSFRDCLRIGKILIDVQAWQQYDFDIVTTSPNL